MIHLLATDMDGTLLNSQKEFDNEFFEVLQKVLEKEMYFVIASEIGRASCRERV